MDIPQFSQKAQEELKYQAGWTFSRMKTKRYYIEGVTDDMEGNDLYLNKDTSAYPFGSGSPIRYVKE